MEKTNIPSIYKKGLKNGDISWFGVFRNPLKSGKADTKKLGTKNKDNIKTAKQALQFLDRLLETLKNQKAEKFKKLEDDNQDRAYLRVNEIDFDNYTINQIAEYYFEDKTERKTQELRTKYNYLTDYEFNENVNVKKQLYNELKDSKRYYKNVSEYEIANMLIKYINNDDLNWFIEKELPKKNLSQKSNFNIISLIRTILNYGVNEEMITSNPFNKKIAKTVKNPKRKRQRVLSPEELRELLKDAEKAENDNVYNAVYLAVLTAGRENTVLNIQKRDIDFKNNIINLDNFKGKKQYQLTIPTKATEHLKNITKDYDLTDYIVKSSKGYTSKTPQPMTNMPERVYKIMDRLFNEGLNKQNNHDRDLVVNFHSIRRSVATNLARKGTPIYDIMILLNHSSVNQTMDYLNMTSIQLNQGVDSFMNDIFET